MAVVSELTRIEGGFLPQVTREILPAAGQRGRWREPRIHAGECALEIGRTIEMAAGDDVTLIATGLMVGRALTAAALLLGRGVQAGVLDMHPLKPLDEAAVLRAARRRRGTVVTIEEHAMSGGLGGAVAEVLADHAPGTRLKRLGLPDRTCAEYGTQDHLLDRAGLSTEAIAEATSDFLVLRHA